MKGKVKLMKLTGELKDKVDKAESMEAKKNIIAEAGMELTDEEIEGVAGGLIGHIKFAECRSFGCSFHMVLNLMNPTPPDKCPICGADIYII